MEVRGHPGGREGCNRCVLRVCAVEGCVLRVCAVDAVLVADVREGAGATGVRGGSGGHTRRAQR